MPDSVQPDEHTPREGVGPDDVTLPGAHRFLIFLTFVNVLNFVDRQLLASFANFIVPDLGLTPTPIGTPI
ncbi:MAG: hypothetical protein AAFW65_08135 [Pseudomonadota bacterium]